MKCQFQRPSVRNVLEGFHFGRFFLSLRGKVGYVLRCEGQGGGGT
jgi:hypothetical protein